MPFEQAVKVAGDWHEVNSQTVGVGVYVKSDVTGPSVWIPVTVTVFGVYVKVDHPTFGSVWINNSGTGP